ncbi:MAG: hypothetical protein AAF490_11735 [Chloroflexota bacterium]
MHDFKDHQLKHWQRFGLGIFSGVCLQLVSTILTALFTLGDAWASFITLSNVWIGMLFAIWVFVYLCSSNFLQKFWHIGLKWAIVGYVIATIVTIIYFSFAYMQAINGGEDPFWEGVVFGFPAITAQIGAVIGLVIGVVYTIRK